MITNVMAMFVMITVCTVILKPIYLYDELGHVRSHEMLYGFFSLAGVLCVMLCMSNSTADASTPLHVSV